MACGCPGGEQDQWMKSSETQGMIPVKLETQNPMYV